MEHIFPEYCSWLGMGSALLFLCPQGQLSHDARVRVRSVLHSPQDINMSLSGCLDQGCLPGLGGNRPLLLQVCCMDTDLPPSGSTRQDSTMVPGGITGYSHQAFLNTLESPFCLSSLCPYPSVYLSLLFLYHLFAPLSGSQGLSASGHLRSSLKSTMPCSCIMGLCFSGLVVVSG